MRTHLLSILAVTTMAGLLVATPAQAKGYGERHYSSSLPQYYSSAPRYVQHYPAPHYNHHDHHGNHRHANCRHGHHGRHPQPYYRPGYYPQSYYPQGYYGEGVAVLVTPHEYAFSVRVRR